MYQGEGGEGNGGSVEGGSKRGQSLLKARDEKSCTINSF